MSRAYTYAVRKRAIATRLTLMSGVILIWFCLAAPLTAAASVKITEYRVPAVSAGFAPNGITAGPDGALWFTENYKLRSGFLQHSKIGRITTRGHFSEFPIPTDLGGPFSITTGADGALWFTEYDLRDEAIGRIGRITTAGRVTEFPVPTRLGAWSHPRGITAGPDGALWFTESILTGSLATGTLTFTSSGKIGRITTSGALSELPTAGEPFEITTGPDGALWFTEPLQNRIGRITTGGVVTEFTTPGEASGITTGPDGALWFTAHDTIGRITTTGSVSEFALPKANSGSSGITTGHDGALWFTEYTGHRIGRITTTGRITEFPLPPRRGLPSRRRFPTGIAAGPDGAIWFTEGAIGGSAFIGRITTTKLRNSCSRLKGRALKRCRARKHALARCRRITNKKRRRSCIKRVERAYR